VRATLTAWRDDITDVISAGVGCVPSHWIQNVSSRELCCIPFKQFIHPDGVGSSWERKQIHNVCQNTAHQYVQERDNCNRMFSKWPPRLVSKYLLVKRQDRESLSDVQSHNIWIAMLPISDEGWDERGKDVGGHRRCQRVLGWVSAMRCAGALRKLEG